MTVLIIEDGDEYLDNLSRFVSGPRYLQAHDAAEALDVLAREPVDLVYLDMRFDRIDPARLVGDASDQPTPERFLQNNQGLFILAHLHQAGHTELPVIVAYDFSREPKRLAFLHQTYPRMRWVADAVTPQEIRAVMDELLE